MEIIIERNIIERDEENREARVFHVVRLCEPMFTKYAISLLIFFQ
jgi:hypothetical protein